jgi:hypothetical protein
VGDIAPGNGNGNGGEVRFIGDVTGHLLLSRDKLSGEPVGAVSAGVLKSCGLR